MWKLTEGLAAASAAGRRVVADATLPYGATPVPHLAGADEPPQTRSD